MIALVETAKGIMNAEEILSVEGIDAGRSGHDDLSNTIGITAQFDGPESNAVSRAFWGLARHQKATGLLARPSPEPGSGAPGQCQTKSAQVPGSW